MNTNELSEEKYTKYNRYVSRASQNIMLILKNMHTSQKNLYFNESTNISMKFETTRIFKLENIHFIHIF